MFHDVVEIESGDMPLHPNNNFSNKKEIELKAAENLKHKLPKSQGEKFFDLFSEFEENKTDESKFANAIDKFDAVIHEIDYKSDWKGWSKKFLLDKKEKFFLDFPEIKEDFHKVLDYVETKGYFN
jgi:5'-deoxynucleotidase YfbR-like HD superfamily hydrolase